MRKIWFGALALVTFGCARAEDFAVVLVPDDLDAAVRTDTGVRGYGNGKDSSSGTSNPPPNPTDDSGIPQIPQIPQPDASTLPGSPDSALPPDPQTPDPPPGSTGLDPKLSLPGSGSDCTRPGSSFGCSFSEVCRIATTTGGRCESCIDCGGLFKPCTTNMDCDILFQCYAGACTPICDKSTPQTCGTTCLDVGNDQFGVCERSN